ncbi:MAG: nucleotidyltransferase family protein [Oscillospiraceae bacterium]|nr:nucleotidyltransferase family protein [Oscillospiraceae bacterium]
MINIGIICEYNPFHLGHALHISKTKEIIKQKHGDDCDVGVICAMSGNFAQRGDFAIFNKHARAKMAVLCGADLVIEIAAPYALSSAEGFARAGVHLIDSLGICGYLSFGSESGNMDDLNIAADMLMYDKAGALLKDALGRGLSYALAQQSAADALLGEKSDIFRSPNNILAIEYIKALRESDSKMKPITVTRTGGKHDGDTGYSALSLRRAFGKGQIPQKQMPKAAADVCMEEIASGKGPVSIKSVEQAILSRLRTVSDFAAVPGGTDGLDRRFLRVASEASSIEEILREIKTKRFAMSRIRRMLMCAVLGITYEHIRNPPPYIRVLAMNKTGMRILNDSSKGAGLPIITKPASVKKLCKQSIALFEAESRATDFYVLAYQKESCRAGGSEWRQSPIVV